jgi:hypothetical protein
MRARSSSAASPRPASGDGWPPDIRMKGLRSTRTNSAGRLKRPSGRRRYFVACGRRNGRAAYPSRHIPSRFICAGVRLAPAAAIRYQHPMARGAAPGRKLCSATLRAQAYRHRSLARGSEDVARFRLLIAIEAICVPQFLFCDTKSTSDACDCIAVLYRVLNVVRGRTRHCRRSRRRRVCRRGSGIRSPRREDRRLDRGHGGRPAWPGRASASARLGDRLVDLEDLFAAIAG